MKATIDITVMMIAVVFLMIEGMAHLIEEMNLATDGQEIIIPQAGSLTTRS